MTSQQYDGDLHAGPSFGDLVLRAVQRFPDRDALVQGDQRITYRQMGVRTAQIMQALKAAGLGQGAALCQLAPNSADGWMLRVACYLLGIRYTPLHPLGSADDHAYIITDSEADALVCDASFSDRADTLLARDLQLKHVFSLGPANFGEDLLDLADRQPERQLWCEADPSGVAGLVYTGGTTGQPKGVIHHHNTLVTNVLMTLAEWDWPKEIRLLALTPLSHASGALVVPVFLKGGTVHLQDGFDPDAMLACIEQEKITATFLVPTMIYVLLDHPKTRQTDTSSLEFIIYGASPMSPTRLLEAMEIFGPVFMQLYAQSEAPMTVTALPQWAHDPNRPERLASCGYPLAGVQVKLLDDDGSEVPVGEVGEICVRGPLVMEGYWKKPEETAKALQGGWLHTGDMARQDEDGFLYIVDRKKDMIISGGFNVYPKEVEDVLMSHPSVAQASVIGVPDEKWGEAVTAVVVAKNGAEIGADELIALVKDKKGAVQAPKQIEFVDAIPVTALGKPDKKAIRARYWGSADRQVH